MIRGPERHFEPSERTHVFQRGLPRFLIGTSVILFWLGMSQGIGQIGDSLIFDAIEAAVLVAGSAASYWAYVTYVEERSLTELALPGAGRELSIGVAIGAGLLLSSLAIVVIAGGANFPGGGSWNALLVGLFAAIGAGWAEELLVRGVALRILDEWLGPWPALLISAAIFGLLHLGNDNATAWTTTAIALEAGILLGAAYLFTRRLWMAIGIHFAWNFFQGGVFGIPVSGEAMSGLIPVELETPTWLTGGDFGLEASVAVVGLCLAVAAYLLRGIRTHA